MLKIRGTRSYVTLTTDGELPEAERRVFVFVNPSVTHLDRLINDCTNEVDGKRMLRTVDIIHRILCGWSNVRTDDQAVANKYGVALPVGSGAGDEVIVPYPTGKREAVDINLLELLPISAWNELCGDVMTIVNPPVEELAAVAS